MSLIFQTHMQVLKAPSFFQMCHFTKSISQLERKNFFTFFTVNYSPFESKQTTSNKRKNFQLNLGRSLCTHEFLTSIQIRNNSASTGKTTGAARRVRGWVERTPNAPRRTSTLIPQGRGVTWFRDSDAVAAAALVSPVLGLLAW